MGTKRRLDGEPASIASKRGVYEGDPIGDGASKMAKMGRAEHERLVLSRLCLLYNMLPCIISVETAPILLSPTSRCLCEAEVHAILPHSQHTFPTTDCYHCRSCPWDNLRHPIILTGAVNPAFTHIAGVPKVDTVEAPYS